MFFVFATVFFGGSFVLSLQPYANITNLIFFSFQENLSNELDFGLYYVIYALILMEFIFHFFIEIDIKPGYTELELNKVSVAQQPIKSLILEQNYKAYVKSIEASVT